METKKKYFASWWMWIFLLLIITSITGFILNSIGLIGKTVVERKVFENSYQYSEARKTEQLTYKAQLAEINRKLLSNIDTKTRSNLEAQAAALRIQLNISENR